MPSVIVPVGLSMGPRFRYVRPPDPVPACHEIHLGDELVELPADEAAVWSASFVDPARHSRLAADRAWLVAHLAGTANAAKIVAELLDRGLLLEFDTDGPLEAVFRRFRLLPLAEGLGSTADEPHRQRIGHAGRPLVAVPNMIYTQWAFGMAHAHLWAACEFYADDSTHVAAGGRPLGRTVAGLAREVAAHLPLLVSTSCAFLDPVVQPQDRPVVQP